MHIVTVHGVSVTLLVHCTYVHLIQHELHLPTTVKVNQLAHFLEGYDSNLKNNLVQGFTSGFKINSSLDKNVVNIPKNHKSATGNLEVVTQKINKEIQKGMIKGPFKEPQFNNFICSPLGLVPRKRKWFFSSNS